MNYPHLAQRLYNAPLLITPGKGEVIEQVFRSHADGHAPAALAPRQPRPELAAPGMVRAEGGYFRTANGIALIQVIGTLVQRGDSMDAASGLVGYNRIAAQLDAAVADPRADAILLEIDSNGGEAAGIMDLAGKIAAANKRKPTWAIANEAAFSAAYWLASAAGRVSAPVSAMVGSIGVVMFHVDQSVRDAKAGYTYTPLYAGARKVDFSAHAPLSDAARTTGQAEVDRLYEMFVGAVANARKMDPAAVRETDAGIFDALAAHTMRLIDAVETFDETLTALGAEAMQFRVHGPLRAGTSARSSLEGNEMSNQDKTAGAAVAQPSAEQLAEAQARGFAEGKAEGIKAGTQDERARIAAILTHAEAEGRGPLAQHLAFKTANTIEDAAAMLAVAPKQSAAVPTNVLAARMAGVKQPLLGADAGETATTGPKLDAGNVYAMRRTAAAKANAQ